MEAGTSQALLIEREVRIDASPATVFEFFTDPARIVRWKGSKATLDPRPGGVYQVEMRPGMIITGEYLEVEPPRRVVFTWGWEDSVETPPGSTTVEITLTPDGDGTVVHVVHSGFAATESFEQHGHGWDLFLPRLVIAAAGGDPGPVPEGPGVPR